MTDLVKLLIFFGMPLAGIIGWKLGDDLGKDLEDQDVPKKTTIYQILVPERRDLL